MAMALLYSGKINEGILVLKSINPALMSLEQSFSERYLIEPYALAGDVYSHPECMGRGGWSFYTGSAAWYKKAVLECIFGFTQKNGGFYLRPHMNMDFDGVTLTIDTHETSYTIKYLFSDKEGIVLDGKIVETASERMREFFFEFDKNKHHVDYCIKLRED
jgi:cyclic beta-1,2-glucan synthetase